jgi:type I restriction-modification system DNA methylase subunit
MNTGHKGQQHDIFAYNGGLFAPDEILDNIIINDELLYKHTVNLSNYDFESEVSVNILGHIFEHSLNDIDEIQSEIQGISTDQSNTKRKKDGVFYTPKYITKYIVDNTVGKLCEDKKIELDIQETEYEKERKGRQKATLKNLTQKLEDYRKWLLQITICDPACGSGAFLNQALEFLITEHKYIDELQAKLFGDAMILSEVENSILENNLFGVDINDESVDIAKLSLWLRTAQKGRKLTSLNSNIKSGNSLIEDPSVAGKKAFNWQEEFPKVFAKGGFDVIIGNPPYVSSKGENFSDVEKQYFIENYQCAVYQIDLYLLFNEKSLLISNQKGIISLIEPNAWMNNLFLKPIRKFLLDNTTIYEIVNTPIGVFKDATVDTVILTFARKVETLIPINISEARGQDIIYLHSKDAISFANNENFDFDILVSQEAKQIVSKLEKKKEYLIDISVASSGIKEYEKGKGNPPQTAEDVKSKPFNSTVKLDDSYQKHISGSDVTRYVLNWQGNYLKYGECIAAPRNSIFFEGERLIIREIPGKNSLIVSYTSEKYTVKNTAHIFKINNAEYSIFGLLGILNSKLMGFYFKNKFSEDDDVFPKAKIGQCKKLPISINLRNNINFNDLVKKIISSLDEVNILSKNFSELLSSKFSISKPTKKLQNWHELDFSDFIKELDKVRKKSVKERGIEYNTLSLSVEAEWMQYFNEQKQKAEKLKIEIDKTDRKIDEMVYELYGLTEEEINIVEEAKT